jgi:hypothetical protein
LFLPGPQLQRRASGVLVRLAQCPKGQNLPAFLPDA